MRKFKRGAKKFKKFRKARPSDYDVEILRITRQQAFDNMREAMEKLGWYCAGPKES